MQEDFYIPNSPFFTFIKGIEQNSFINTLKLFDLSNRTLVDYEKAKYNDDCIFLFRDKIWVHIMDNFSYSHWHSKNFKLKIEELGKSFEIFSFSVGDVDFSFEFRLFRNGGLVREYIVESPNFNDEIITKNFGKPLKGEEKGLQKKDQLMRVIHIAQSLGIEFPKNQSEINCYI